MAPSVTGRPAAVLPLLLLAAACARPDAGGRGIAVTRDSAGVVIVENVSPDAPGVPVRVWTQVLDIGDAAGAGPTAFFRVAGAALLGDGRIAVADAGSSEVRFFDAGGAFLSAIGRAGEGPGEYLDIARMRHGAGDSLFVYDGAARRLSVIGPRGDPARVLLFGIGAVPGDLLGRLADGAWLATTSDLPGGEFGAAPGPVRPPMYVVRVPADGGVPVTIGAVPGREVVVRTTGRGPVLSQVPFARESHAALSGGRIWLATGDAPEIRQYDETGRLLRIIRTAQPVRPVDAAAVDAWVAYRASYRSGADTAAGEGPADAVRRSLEGVPIPATVPPWGPFVPGDAGEVWVPDFHDPAAPSGDWTVYGPDGAIRARVRLPAGLRLLDVGPDHLIGSFFDHLDVEHVVLFRRS